MVDSDFNAFKQGLLMLAEAFEAEASEVRQLTYFEALRDLSLEQWKRACAVAIGQWKIVRTLVPPAVLREYALGGTQDDQSARAWEILTEAWRRAGIYDSVLFEDGASGQALLKLFGNWTGFCTEYESLSPEMVASRRKQFMAAWKDARLKSQPCYLPGLVETSNQSSAPTWDHPEDAVFSQPVLVVSAAGEMQKIEARFSRATGRLLTPAQHLLHPPLDEEQRLLTTETPDSE